MLEIAFRPDRTSPAPLYQQLARALRGLVEAGRLQPGERLPASRELAASLGLSRATVNLAYETLIAWELAHAHVGRGTFVTRPPGRRGRTAPAAARREHLVWAGMLSAASERLHRDFAGVALPPRRRFDFRPAVTAPGDLPLAELQRTARAAFAELSGATAWHGVAGWPALRVEIARQLLARGVVADPDQVLVTSGAQQAFDLVARTLLEPGDRAAVEQPGYFGVAAAIRAAGASPVGIEVDGDGLRVDQLQKILGGQGPKLRLVCATPAVQCPTGVRLSDDRRAALLELAARHQVPVLDDDYDGELRGGGPALPALASEEGQGLVIHVGTFSKTTLPALRLGYVVGVPELVERLVEAKVAADRGSDVLAQLVMAEWLRNGGFERHVKRLRRRFAHRLGVLLDTLSGLRARGVETSRPAGGTALWVALPAAFDAARFRGACARAELSLISGDGFRLDRRGADRLYLNVAGIADDEIAEGAGRLADCLRASCSALEPRARSAPRDELPRRHTAPHVSPRSRKER